MNTTAANIQTGQTVSISGISKNSTIQVEKIELFNGGSMNIHGITSKGRKVVHSIHGKRPVHIVR